MGDKAEAPSDIARAFGYRGKGHEIADVVSAVVDFANGDTTPSYRTRMSQMTELPPDWPDELPDPCYALTDAEGEPRFVDEATATRYASKRIEAERQRSIEMLNAAVTGADALTGWLDDHLRERTPAWAEHGSLGFVTVIRPWVSIGGKRARIEWRLSGPDSHSESWLDLAAAHLSASAHGDQTEVGKCKYRDCGKFFEKVRGKVGNPQTLYCSAKCRDDEHNRMSAYRQRMSRAARKARRKRK